MTDRIATSKVDEQALTTAPAGTPVDAALEIRDMRKHFGGTTALDGASCVVRAGAAHAIIGENGAGKSTLVKIISGAIVPDAGAMYVAGSPVGFGSVTAARRMGIGTAFQETSLAPDLTVAASIWLASEPRSKLGVVVSPRLYDATDELFGRLGIQGIDPGWLVRDLTLPEKQTVEIAKCLRDEPRVVVFDESTSALDETGVAWFYSVVDGLKQRGATIIFVTHRHAEMREVCETLTILRNGRDVGSFAVGEVSGAEVIRLMIGRSLEAAFPPKRPPQERPVALEVVGLERSHALHDVSLRVGRGEIVGVCGLAGHGQRELFLALFGMLRTQRGEVLVDGERVRLRGPRDAIKAGVGISLVPEDRKTEGLFLRLPVTINLAFAALPRLSRGGWIRTRRVQALVERVADRLNVARRALSTEAGALSGGNQQKVVIGKWVAAESRYLLLYDPTRGVDVGTKLEIYKLMHDLADEGLSILFYSSELNEVVELSDRVYAFYRSRIVAEFSGASQTEENIMTAMTGH